MPCLKTCKRSEPFFFLFFTLGGLITSIGLLVGTIFNNVPLFNPHNSLSQSMDYPRTSWLLTINQTSSTSGGGGGGGAKASGQLKFGFGVWGWCTWGDSDEAVQGLAKCTRKAFWTIPGSAVAGDVVETLDLPRYVLFWSYTKGGRVSFEYWWNTIHSSIASSLGVASFLLIIR